MSTSNVSPNIPRYDDDVFRRSINDSSFQASLGRILGHLNNTEKMQDDDYYVANLAVRSLANLNGDAHDKISKIEAKLLEWNNQIQTELEQRADPEKRGQNQPPPETEETILNKYRLEALYCIFLSCSKLREREGDFKVSEPIAESKKKELQTQQAGKVYWSIWKIGGYVPVLWRFRNSSTPAQLPSAKAAAAFSGEDPEAWIRRSWKDFEPKPPKQSPSLEASLSPMEAIEENTDPETVEDFLSCQLEGFVNFLLLTTSSEPKREKLAVSLTKILLPLFCAQPIDQKQENLAKIFFKDFFPDIILAMMQSILKDLGNMRIDDKTLLYQHLLLCLKTHSIPISEPFVKLLCSMIQNQTMHPIKAALDKFLERVRDPQINTPFLNAIKQPILNLFFPKPANITSEVKSITIHVMNCIYIFWHHLNKLNGTLQQNNILKLDDKQSNLPNKEDKKNYHLLNLLGVLWQDADLSVDADNSFDCLIDQTLELVLDKLLRALIFPEKASLKPATIKPASQRSPSVAPLKPAPAPKPNPAEPEYKKKQEELLTQFGIRLFEDYLKDLIPAFFTIWLEKLRSPQTSQEMAAHLALALFHPTSEAEDEAASAPPASAVSDISKKPAPPPSTIAKLSPPADKAAAKPSSVIPDNSKKPAPPPTAIVKSTPPPPTADKAAAKPSPVIPDNLKKPAPTSAAAIKPFPNEPKDPSHKAKPVPSEEIDETMGPDKYRQDLIIKFATSMGMTGLESLLTPFMLQFFIKHLLLQPLFIENPFELPETTQGDISDKKFSDDLDRYIIKISNEIIDFKFSDGTIDRILGSGLKLGTQILKVLNLGEKIQRELNILGNSKAVLMPAIAGTQVLWRTTVRPNVTKTTPANVLQQYFFDTLTAHEPAIPIKSWLPSQEKQTVETKARTEAEHKAQKELLERQVHQLVLADKKKLEEVLSLYIPVGSGALADLAQRSYILLKDEKMLKLFVTFVLVGVWKGYRGVPLPALE